MEKNDYRVLMSTLGRSHFIVAADSIIRQGVKLILLQGWVPKQINCWQVKLCARIIGRQSFIAGLEKRKTPALKGRIVSESLGELLQTVLLLSIGRLSQRLRHWSVKLAFHTHGYCTRKNLSNIDVLHIKSGLGGGGLIKVAKKQGIKVLVDHCTPHPYFMGKIMKKKGYKEKWTFWNRVLDDCNQADLLMVGSEFIKETFIDQGYKPSKIRVVPLGVLDIFFGAKKKYINTGTLKLIYTGSWIEQKGASFLVDAIELLVNQGVECHLSVFGSYNERDEFVKRGKGLPITLHGHVPQEMLKTHLAESDIFVFPSLSDGFAVSGVEAMGAGLCIITTRESSIPVVHGETGFVVPAKSGEAIANQVTVLYNNRKEIEKIGQRAATVVSERFTWVRYALNVKEVYEELVRN